MVTNSIKSRWEEEQNDPRWMRELQDVPSVRNAAQAKEHLTSISMVAVRKVNKAMKKVSAARAFDIVAAEFGFVYSNFRPE